MKVLRNNRRLIGTILITLLVTAGNLPNRAMAQQDSQPRIVGGEPASPGAYPWMAALLGGGSQFCGGALIRSDWVLTAAHCVEGTDSASVEVLLGTIDLSGNDSERIPVQRIVVHPDYGQQGYPDLALLQLSKASTQTPINLVPTGSGLDRAGTVATAIGWGVTDPSGQGSGTNLLQQVSVPIVTQQVCNDAYGDIVEDAMICAGLPEGGKDSCFGDSGGPLFVKGSNNEDLHAGVVSFGSGCAEPNFPGVYARVSTNNQWIESIAGAGTPGPGCPNPNPGSNQTLTGTIAQEFDAVSVPEGGFSVTAGQLIGQLKGPADADFDLYLERLNSQTGERESE